MREKITELLNRRRKALLLDDIASFLQVEDRQALEQELDELVVQGYLRKTKKQKYSLLSETGCFVGDLQLTDRGFGFFIFEDKSQPDVFIHGSNLNGAMNGDKVLVCITSPRTPEGNAEGVVERVLEHRTSKVIGRLDLAKNTAFVIPMSRKVKQDIYVPMNELKGARKGQIVEVSLTEYPAGNRNPVGAISHILGNPEDTGIEMETIIRAFDLPEVFPPEVMREAEAIGKVVPEAEIRRRRDLRADYVVTIDGADAKDFDDAIAMEKTKDGYKLSVHIADVTHYVKEGSAIDREALKRGTSVYFPGKVIPMLPESLSNEMCSLKPDEDRLCLSVDIYMDDQGRIKDSDIYESVIRSKKRLIYDDVSDFLDGKQEVFSGEEAEDLKRYAELAALLRDIRFKRGAIDFGFVESDIIVDTDGFPIRIQKRESRVANKLIEEFMILANEVVSEHFYHLKVPFLYRTHEKPSLEKLEAFNAFIHNFGLKINGKLEEVRPQQLNDIIREVKGKPESNIISKLMLRSLKQAKYTDYMEGHFGLASKYYSHFTSPIRRYPDLQIHRIIKESLNGQLDEARVAHYDAIVGAVAEQSSVRERIADEVEREVDDLKKAQFMEDKIGQEYIATVSGVTNFGVFAELDNTVEGMVRLSDMKFDFFVYDKEHYLIRGQRTGMTISIGDKLKVSVKAVNIDAGEISFEFLEKMSETTGH